MPSHSWPVISWPVTASTSAPLRAPWPAGEWSALMSVLPVVMLEGDFRVLAIGRAGAERAADDAEEKESHEEEAAAVDEMPQGVGGHRRFSSESGSWLVKSTSVPSICR